MDSEAPFLHSPTSQSSNTEPPNTDAKQKRGNLTDVQETTEALKGELKALATGNAALGLWRGAKYFAKDPKRALKLAAASAASFIGLQVFLVCMVLLMIMSTFFGYWSLYNSVKEDFVDVQNTVSCNLDSVFTWLGDDDLISCNIDSEAVEATDARVNIE